MPTHMLSHTKTSPTARFRLSTTIAATLALAGSLCLATAAGCSGRKPGPRPTTVAPVTRDVPSALRGTIGAEATIRGIRPSLASGIGLVVGLNGTGGLPLDDEVAATMERQMGLGGIGRANTGANTAIDGMTPRQLLADKNTAVVMVQAAIPPGAVNGDTFDIYVRALNATSLEGGKLWTTELRAGPPATFGARTTKLLAEGRGDIFVNPFSEPGSDDGEVGTVGRVLDGGVMLTDLRVEAVLDNPSHRRAREIVSAINTRFPPRPGDPPKIARGHDDSLVTIHVPRRYQRRAADFVELIRYAQINTAFTEEYARRYAATLQSQPALADEMGWALEALGEQALPFIRELYENSEEVPRLAALRAGAGLDDAAAVPHLAELAIEGRPGIREQAIAHLGRVSGGPTVEQVLRGLLAEKDLTVRIAAYEALARRAERAQYRRVALASMNESPSAVRLDPDRVELLARMRLPAGTLQAVSRKPIAGKFLLDRVPVGDPLIYVTQQGEPRIVLFGSDPELKKPLLVSAWSQRLMLTASSPADSVRLLYRDLHTGRAQTYTPPTDLADLIEFLAHEPTPEDPRPGLGLSYSETVGALFEIYDDAGTNAAFATERDRLLAQLLESGRGDPIELRAETEADEAEVVIFDGPTGQPTRPDRNRHRSLLVPLTPPAAETPAPDASLDEAPNARPEQ